MNQKEKWFIVKVITNLLTKYTMGKSYNYMGNQQKEAYKDVHEVYDILGYNSLTDSFVEGKKKKLSKKDIDKVNKEAAKELNDFFNNF